MPRPQRAFPRQSPPGLVVSRQTMTNGKSAPNVSGRPEDHGRGGGVPVRPETDRRIRRAICSSSIDAIGDRGGVGLGEVVGPTQSGTCGAPRVRRRPCAANRCRASASAASRTVSISVTPRAWGSCLANAKWRTGCSWAPTSMTTDSCSTNLTTVRACSPNAVRAHLGVWRTWRRCRSCRFRTRTRQPPDAR